MDMYRRTYAEVNLDALEHNVQVLQKGLGSIPFFCPMVKANAYGHGDVQVAKCFELMGVNTVGVCLIEEGLLLRNFGFKGEILVFRGFDQMGAQKIIANKMTPVVSSWRQLQHLEDLASAPISVHLKFDTGMNRLGFAVEDADKLFDKCWQNSKIRVKAVLTHLLEGEDAQSDTGRSSVQLQGLAAISQRFKSLGVFAHALNSAGAINKMILSEGGHLDSDKSRNQKVHPLNLENWGVRPGLSVYGYDPVTQDNHFNLKPVMSLKSQVSVLRRLKVGETVSYGGTFRAERESVIGVVPIGYADGYHRILSNRSHVLFEGKLAPVVGNVCMDYLMIDVTEIVGSRALDPLLEKEVVLFGAGNDGGFISASTVASKAQTITWEILTSVGERVPRVFKGRRAEEVLKEIGR